jgi:hypothetical protein
VGDNPIRDLDLAAHGVDGYQGAFELPCPGEVIEKLRDGGDLIGFFRNAELGQGQPGMGRVGGERVQSLQALAFVMRAARGLAVDRDQVVPTGPERPDPVLEAAPEQDRIDTVDQRAQPPLARDGEMKRREPPEKFEVCRPQAAISSKSSHDAMVAQVRSSSTSDNGYITRQLSRSSSRREKCSRSRASRARGSASSISESVTSSMLAPLSIQCEP